MQTETNFPWQQEAIIRHSQLLLSSFKHWTGNILLNTEGAPIEIAKTLFEAPFVLVSHGVQADPILNYGNQKALDLWEMTWEQFTSTLSRYTAEEMEQSDRFYILNQTKTKGFVENYRGIRVSSKGKRFLIEGTMIWNIIDEQNKMCGQAALFSQYKMLN